jgi:hypothetical protein
VLPSYLPSPDLTEGKNVEALLYEFFFSSLLSRLVVIGRSRVKTTFMLCGYCGGRGGTPVIYVKTEEYL